MPAIGIEPPAIGIVGPADGGGDCCCDSPVAAAGEGGASAAGFAGIEGGAELVGAVGVGVESGVLAAFEPGNPGGIGFRTGDEGGLGDPVCED